MNDEQPIEFPELTTADLDIDELSALFRDIVACTQLLDVLQKGGTEQHADPDPVGLEAAREALVGGSVRGLQIRYLYDGEEWRDTIIGMNGSFRLTRIAVSRHLAPGGATTGGQRDDDE